MHLRKTLILAFLILLSIAFGRHLLLQRPLLNNPFDDIKVPLVLGVMSACPDAILCEHVFDEVLSETGDKVDLSLSFLASLNASEPDWGVTCKHGPNECAGNVQQLCATKYAHSRWWDFVQCLNREEEHRIGLPDVALKCAEGVGINWATSGVGECAGLDGSGKGSEGALMLRESVRHSAELNITKSCTIMISGKKVCVHDEVWEECEGGHSVGDFVRQIKHEYRRLNK